MADKHKAPTQVQIARTVEASAFQSFVEKYWKIGLVLFLAVAGSVLFQSYRSERGRETAAQNWSRLASEVSFGSGFSSEIEPSSPAAMASIAADFRGSPLGGWAKALEAKAHLEADATDAALKSLEDLQGWGKHPLNTLQIPVAPDQARPLVPFVKERLQALESWKSQHASLFTNPPLADNAPRVLLKTSRGNLTVALDHQRAPLHVENFLKLVEEGFYTGTKFHSVTGALVQGGDPNTREGEESSWGQGGPGYTLEPEINELKHFKYVLGAAPDPGDGQSSGSQFYLATDTAHHLDGRQTVFGKLVDGFEVLEDIATAPVEAQRPIDPVVIESARLVE